MIKPFQRSELVPAVHVALARFREDQALAQKGNEDVSRSLVDQAKAILMDECGLDESGAIAFLGAPITGDELGNADLTARASQVVKEGLRPSADDE